MGGVVRVLASVEPRQRQQDPVHLGSRVQVAVESERPRLPRELLVRRKSLDDWRKVFDRKRPQGVHGLLGVDVVVKGLGHWQVLRVRHRGLLVQQHSHDRRLHGQNLKDLASHFPAARVRKRKIVLDLGLLVQYVPNRNSVCHILTLKLGHALHKHQAHVRDAADDCVDVEVNGVV